MLERENFSEVLSEVKKGVTKKSASRKDEVTIMKAMLNDPEYKVGIYSKEGQTGTYCPYEDSRKMLSNIIASTTKIPSAEATELSNNYAFTKADATSMVGISKEFVSTYAGVGRKLPLGGRETSNVFLIGKHVDERVRNRPQQNGEVVQTRVPAFDTIRVMGTCPAWCKK